MIKSLEKLKYKLVDFTLTMALYFSFSCWYMRLYFSTGSRDKVLLNSLLLHSVAQRTSLGSRSVDSQGSFGYATPSESHASGVNACSSKALQRKPESSRCCFVYIYPSDISIMDPDKLQILYRNWKDSGEKHRLLNNPSLF